MVEMAVLYKESGAHSKAQAEAILDFSSVYIFLSARCQNRCFLHTPEDTTQFRATTSKKNAVAQTKPRSGGATPPFYLYLF